MLRKNYSRSDKICRVTFSLPAEVEAKNVALCGDFNGWDNNDYIMKKLKNGGFSITISLPAGRSYRFRYLLDGERWENDWDADSYLPNSYGSEDSVVVV
jgi:1,4-alpha-glucan branching enzyme